MLNSCVLNIDNQWANEFKPFKCHWYPFGWQFNNNSSAYLTAISSHSPTCAYATTYFAHINMEQTRNELRRNKIKRWRQTIIMSICMKGNGHWITKINRKIMNGHHLFASLLFLLFDQYAGRMLSACISVDSIAAVSVVVVVVIVSKHLFYAHV